MPRHASLLPLLVVLACRGDDERPVGFVRAPYLQSVSETAATIVWRTDAPAAAKVRYGTAVDALDAEVSVEAPRNHHEVRLTGLEPETRYYYSVGTAGRTLAPADAAQFVTTAPPKGARRKVRVWAFGDSGTLSAGQLSVRDSLHRLHDEAQPDLLLHLGDIAYNESTDLQLTQAFFGVYAQVLRRTPAYPAFGNHDGRSSSAAAQSGPYFQAFVLPARGEAGGVPSGTEAYYSFDWANVHFVVLDSFESSRRPGGPMLTWLAADLAATTQPWTVALWHHPPYSKGTHDSDVELELVEMRRHVLPVLEAGGVDLVLSGHSHGYERSYLLHGAYATPSTAGNGILDGGDGSLAAGRPYVKSEHGTIYAVCGAGGASLGGLFGHPLMARASRTFGSCLLDVDGDVLSLRELRADGSAGDHVTLMGPGALALVEPNGDVPVRQAATQAVRWSVAEDAPITVRVEYRCQGGDGWELLAASAASTFTWQTPQAARRACVLRVTDTQDPSRFDESDAPFDLVAQGGG